jgi:hypothetical protein
LSPLPVALRFFARPSGDKTLICRLVGGLDSTDLALVALAILPWIATQLSSERLPGGIALA